MEERVRQRVFEPFFTTKEVGKGTGLGLSIVYGIVKQHNGYINCDSEPGHGTTFRMYIPLVRAAVDRQASPPGDAPRGTETILVAEDDPTVRSFVGGLLAEFGYRVIEARDGEEAVARFRERPNEIGICLFDLIMPKQKGPEAFAVIRAIDPAARVLFMSGHPADQFPRAGLLKDVTAFVSKPVLPRDLLRKVRDALDRPPRTDA